MLAVERIAKMLSKVFNADDGAIRVEGGSSDMRFLYGDTAPDETIGRPEDIYLDTSLGDLYKNINGTWTLIMNLVGPQGEEGEQGNNGEDGRGIVDITSDGEKLTFHMSDETTIEVPWPEQNE